MFHFELFTIRESLTCWKILVESFLSWFLTLSRLINSLIKSAERLESDPTDADGRGKSVVCANFGERER